MAWKGEGGSRCRNHVMNQFLNAFTFAFCEKQGFTRRSDVWRTSLKEMVRTTGCNAVILPVCAWQDHAYSTVVDGTGPDIMDREDVLAVCHLARELGMAVIIKAMVNCRDGYWRAYIRFFDPPVPTEPLFSDWFDSYEEHVLRTAALAEEIHAELFCAGCEMVGTDGQDARWRLLISRVRDVYHGPVTYNCDKYQEDRLTWWDALDVMSSSGYYPLSDMRNQFLRIQEAAKKWNKPFLFMECGCPSRGGSRERPNDWRYGNGLSLEDQEIWYREFLDALQAFPFVRGTGWWDWSATRLYPEEDGITNHGYCVYGKPAAGVLAERSPYLK